MSFFPYEPPYEDDDPDDLCTPFATNYVHAVAQVAPEAALATMVNDHVATLLNRLQAAGLAAFDDAERSEMIARLSAQLQAVIHAGDALDDPRREQQVAHMLRWLDASSRSDF